MSRVPHTKSALGLEDPRARRSQTVRLTGVPGRKDLSLPDPFHRQTVLPTRSGPHARHGVARACARTSGGNPSSPVGMKPVLGGSFPANRAKPPFHRWTHGVVAPENVDETAGGACRGVAALTVTHTPWRFESSRGHQSNPANGQGRIHSTPVHGLPKRLGTAAQVRAPLAPIGGSSQRVPTFGALKIRLKRGQPGARRQRGGLPDSSVLAPC
jgi:hypothetical protein